MCLSLLPALRASADADFDLDAKGMTHNQMLGRTIVGVTRDGSSVFSVYINPDKTAQFHLSNGTRATASGEKLDSHILCFKGLAKDKPDDQLCKRAPELGRGMDWATIILNQKDGKTTYALENPDEPRGSSQMAIPLPATSRSRSKAVCPTLANGPALGSWGAHSRTRRRGLPSLTAMARLTSPLPRASGCRAAIP